MIQLSEWKIHTAVNPQLLTNVVVTMTTILLQWHYCSNNGNYCCDYDKSRWYMFICRIIGINWVYFFNTLENYMLQPYLFIFFNAVSCRFKIYTCRKMGVHSARWMRQSCRGFTCLLWQPTCLSAIDEWQNVTNLEVVSWLNDGDPSAKRICASLQSIGQKLSFFARLTGRILSHNWKPPWVWSPPCPVSMNFNTPMACLC